MALTGLVAANNLGDVVDIEKTWDNIGNNISANVFVPSPTLDLNFASNKSLVDNVSGQNLITFGRASTGTFVGSNGLVQTAASGVPRFDHDPTTGESLGLLIEEARTNRHVSSQSIVGNFNNGYYSCVVNPTGAPNGGSYTTFAQLTSTVPDGNWVTFNYDTTGLTYGSSIINFSFYARSSFSGVQISLSSVDGVVIATPALTNQWQRYTSAFTWQGYNTVRFYRSTGGLSVGQSFDICMMNIENGFFPTSFILTSGTTVTRAGDYAVIDGSNFSRWYTNNQGTFYAAWRHSSSLRNQAAAILGTNGYEGNGFINTPYSIYTTTTPQKAAAGFTDLTGYTTTPTQSSSIYTNGAAGGSNGPNRYSGPSTSLEIGLKVEAPSGSKYLNGTISRVAYYPIRVANLSLQALSTYGPVSSFPYSFSIKGRDILALKEVNKTSTKDFIFTKGLLSRAQPRLTTASQYTSSGVALRDAAMPKFAPVTRGNYLFSSGLTLSGATVQINGTNALSIATSPFSSSTATVPLLFAGLRPQTNWRISEAMASGVVASPESAIPIATGDFLLFMKAGQS
jgi:hypothetical protein